MEHPDLHLMIQRADAAASNATRSPHQTASTGPLSTLRASTGNALIVLGMRIAPANASSHPRLRTLSTPSVSTP